MSDDRSDARPRIARSWSPTGRPVPPALARDGDELRPQGHRAHLHRRGSLGFLVLGIVAFLLMRLQLGVPENNLIGP